MTYFPQTNIQICLCQKNLSSGLISYLLLKFINMEKITSEMKRHEKFIFRFSVCVSILSLIIVLGLIIAQVYVRWYTNQTFTFLGGSELEVLTISAFTLVLGLLYAYRPQR